jgi:Spondin_N
MFYSKALIAASFALAASVASADYGYKVLYEVSITNITKGQTFTPVLVSSHSKAVSLFELGDEASAELQVLAEGGDTAPLTSILESTGSRVSDVQTIAGLLEPGATATVTIQARPNTRFLSLAAMLIPTNDTFVSLNGVKLPRHGSRTYYAVAYDAGSEANDQSCANIPGPRCGGEGASVASDTDEGFVHVSNGFHDLGEFDSNGAEVLGPQLYDWRNPVAKVSIKRVHARY